MNQNNELYHYGVLGMKWGKRKAKQYENTANRLNSHVTRKKEQGKLLTVRDANISAKAASLNSRAKDLKSDQKVSVIKRAKNANTARATAVSDARKYNKQIKETKATAKQQIKQDKYNEMVKDNDKRVKMYGKNAVKVGGAIGIASTAYGMHVGNQVIKSIGKSSMKAIAENPNRGNIALHTASMLTVAGMGALTVSSLKRMNAYRKDMKLADEYKLRQYIKKQNKK